MKPVTAFLWRLWPFREKPVLNLVEGPDGGLYRVVAARDATAQEIAAAAASQAAELERAADATVERDEAAAQAAEKRAGALGFSVCRMYAPVMLMQAGTDSFIQPVGPLSWTPAKAMKFTEDKAEDGHARTILIVSRFWDLADPDQAAHYQAALMARELEIMEWGEASTKAA